MNNYNNIWVFIETSNNQPKRASLEVFAKAEELAKECKMTAVPVFSPSENASPENIVSALASAISKEQPAALLFGSTALGKELSAGITASLSLGIASDCSNIMYRASTKDFLFIRSTFDGKLNASVSLKTFPQVASFSAGTFPLEGNVPNTEANKILLELPSDDTSLRSRLVEFIEDSGLAQSNIEEASVLVAGGRGVGSAEGFESLRELAGLLGGNIAASRAAVDEGWISKDYQVGATGKTVAPKVYFACGISGAPAHVVGMKDSEIIIAINTNASEPIFDIAHYGIVGDLHKVIPELIKILKER
nr:electron transfer flavoprotein subunit alpha/FixB family protein [Frisingicoccus sp.]